MSETPRGKSRPYSKYRGQYKNSRGGDSAKRPHSGSSSKAKRQELEPVDPLDEILYDSSQKSITEGVSRRYVTDPTCPFPLWTHYFAEEPYSHDALPRICKFQDYFEQLFEAKCEAESAEAFDHLVSHPVVTIDYNHVASNSIPAFESQLQDMPLTIIASLGLAATDVISKMARQSDPEDFDPIDDRKVVRIMNYPKFTALKDLKAHLIGKFISIRGTVVRVSSVKPLVTQMTFICTKCDKPSTKVFKDGKFKMQSKCDVVGCKGKTLVPDRSSNSETRTLDWQRIRVQEKLADDQVDSGRVPRIVECELLQDLVDIVVPGDVVSVSGIVKVLATDEGFQ